MVKTMTLDEAVEIARGIRKVFFHTGQTKRLNAITMLLEIAHKELARQEKEIDTKC